MTLTVCKAAQGGDGLCQQCVISKLLISEDVRQLADYSQFSVMLLLPLVTNNGVFQLPKCVEMTKNKIINYKQVQLQN